MPGSNPLFGLNTLGGALVIDTKNGKDNPGASIGILGGSFNRQRLNFENGWVDDAKGMPSVYTLATQQFNTPAQPRGVWVGLTYKFGG